MSVMNITYVITGDTHSLMEFYNNMNAGFDGDSALSAIRSRHLPGINYTLDDFFYAVGYTKMDLVNKCIYDACCGSLVKSIELLEREFEGNVVLPYVKITTVATYCTAYNPIQTLLEDYYPLLKMYALAYNPLIGVYYNTDTSEKWFPTAEFVVEIYKEGSDTYKQAFFGGSDDEQKRIADYLHTEIDPTMDVPDILSRIPAPGNVEYKSGVNDKIAVITAFGDKMW